MRRWTLALAVILLSARDSDTTSRQTVPKARLVRTGASMTVIGLYPWKIGRE
ncbi:MAG: hypothetical protein WBO12_04895 [Xanthobacteraceae bacterium]